jgi:hypothetical protein
MAERTAAEVLAEKLGKAWEGLPYNAQAQTRIDRMAARLAEDPAITVRTDMVVERFIVERHYNPAHYPRYDSEDIRRGLTTARGVQESADNRIIVRPYPEDPIR